MFHANTMQISHVQGKPPTFTTPTLARVGQEIRTDLHPPPVAGILISLLSLTQNRGEFIKTKLSSIVDSIYKILESGGVCLKGAKRGNL